MGILAKHDQAVKTEAAGLNAAVSQEEQAFKQIFATINAGQTNVINAKSAIDSAVSGYDTLVYQNYKIKQKAGNGADVIKKVVQDWGAEAKALLDTAGGTIEYHNIGAHAGFSGVNNFTLAYTPRIPTTGASSVQELPQGRLTSFTAAPALTVPSVVSATPITGTVQSQVGKSLLPIDTSSLLPNLSGIGSNVMIGLAMIVMVIVIIAIARKG